MFTVSGRVINELVELTCAINFSLLFRFEARAQKKKERSKTAEAFMVDGGKGEREKEQLNNSVASNLPPNDYHNSTTFLLMFKKVYTPSSSPLPPLSHPPISKVMKYGNGFGPPD